MLGLIFKTLNIKSRKFLFEKREKKYCLFIFIRYLNASKPISIIYFDRKFQKCHVLLYVICWWIDFMYRLVIFLVEDQDIGQFDLCSSTDA